MPWVAAAFIVLGLVVLAMFAVVALICGLHAWWQHRRLVRHRFADIQAYVAELRARTDPGKQADDLLPSPHEPAEGGDQHERSRHGDRTRPGDGAGEGRYR